MPSKPDLSETLRKIQQTLKETEDIGRKHLEELAEEVMHSFDHAIQAVDRRVNASEEIRKRRALLRRWKLGLWRTLRPAGWTLRHLLSMPFIYSMIVPAVILHVFLEFYQQMAFRLYGIPRVRAREYFVFDRAGLPYLNWLEKVNCLYCSYVNHLFQFSVEIGARTERYWCPIKYANRMKGHHSQYEQFIDFLEAESFREKWKKLRDFSDLKEPRKDPSLP